MPRTAKQSPPRTAGPPHGKSAPATRQAAKSATKEAARGSRAANREVEGGVLRSTITARSQTTLPRGVRQVLNLKPGEQIGYVITGNRVELINPVAEHEDPIVQQFLRLLGRHVLEHPTEVVAPFPADLLARARAAAADGPADHDEALDGAVLL